MTDRGQGKHSAGRLFLAHAGISLVPVLLIGLLLAHSYAAAADARGLAQGVAQANQFAATTVEPVLDGADLRTGVSAAERPRLAQVIDDTIRDGLLLRVRLRDLDGRVVFSPDGSGINETPEDEAVDAAHGRTVALLTRFNTDANDSGAAGEEVVEIYRQVSAGPQHSPVGVLEMYLPYAPIRADVASGSSALYRDLAVGLALLYLVLAALAVAVTRRLRRQAAQNAYLAEHDALTGLPNRRSFVAAVERVTAGEAPRLAAVAILDLDRFKEVNDALGHDNGDDLIRAVADRLPGLLRPGDVVARLGGDEFGLLLHRVVSARQATQVLERLRAAVAEPIAVTDLPLTAESSIGFVLTPDDGADAQTLLQRADIAMYVAKSSLAGVVRYEPAHDQFDAGQLAVVAELQEALRSDTLRLDFQPKLELSDGNVRSVEALLRWRHPRHGELRPDAFLPVAEQTGLIEPLTDWVLARALRHVREWASEGVALTVAVNVSARNLSHADFAARVLAACRHAEVAPTSLVLEITETALFTDVERAAGALAELCGAGVGISIDDFGQGQTSLGFLSRLPVTELKIDRAFVTSMESEGAHAAIVRSVVDLAHNLGLRVVAEGVEDDGTLELLRALGCDAAQGYGIARPMAADDVAHWVALRSRAFTG